jgi:hypothetical protein
MISFELRLAVNETTQIAEIENDFEFIVADYHYACSRSVADLLSPVVCRLRSFDPSISEFCLEIGDADECFGHFLALGYGSILEVCEGNWSKYRRICRALGNQEVENMLLDMHMSPNSILNDPIS